MISSSRSPHGERGLKYDLRDQWAGDLCRSPHGERGLKYGVRERYPAYSVYVAPLTGSVD